MFLTRLWFAFPVVLLLHQVSSTPADLILLKDHFIANLVEENRRISGSQLTDDIELAINLKIEGFLDVISAPTTRSSRDTNELLLNEKSKSMEFIFIKVLPQSTCWFSRSRKFPFACATIDERRGI